MPDGISSTGGPDYENARQRVAWRVRDFRLSRNLTQEAVAARAGLAPRHLQKVEAGEVNITLLTLVKIAVALGVDVDELLKSPPSKTQRQ